MAAAHLNDLECMSSIQLEVSGGLSLPTAALLLNPSTHWPPLVIRHHAMPNLHSVQSFSGRILIDKPRCRPDETIFGNLTSKGRVHGAESLGKEYRQWILPSAHWMRSRLSCSLF